MRSSLALKRIFRRSSASQKRKTDAQNEYSSSESSSGSSFRAPSTDESFVCESFISGPPNSWYPSCGGIYQPLQEKFDEIRLLRLDPGTDGDTLSGKLMTVTLGQRDFEWDALSYVWGSSTNKASLELENGRLLITENLEVALRHLRWLDRERMLWIDAVCINQESSDERSAQIQRMGDIYETATFVIIWLGPDLRGIAAASFAALHTATWQRTPESVQAARLAMQHILQCEWFQRLWVVQEALMAIRATLTWGDANMIYADFQPHALAFNQQGPHELPMWAGEMRDIEASRTRTILHVLEWTRGMKCSDDRDRIYAILGLRYSRAWSREAYDLAKSIVPDYTLSVGEIYQDFAEKCIKNGLLHKLWLFISHHQPWDPDNSELPSWTPDFAQPALPFTTTRSMVHITEQRDDLLRPFRIQPELDRHDFDRRTLLVTGGTVGTVCCVESQCIGDRSPMQSFQNIASFWLNNLKYVQAKHSRNRAVSRRLWMRSSSEVRKRDCLLINVLLSCALHVEGDALKTASLVGSLFDYRAVRSMSPHGSYRCREVMSTFYESFFFMHPSQAHGSEDAPNKMDVMDAYEHVRSVWDCHKLFTVSNGGFGLGPSVMRRGDIVAIIGGAKHPVVLRPHGEHFFLVGNAHVSSIRDWECEKRERTIWKKIPLQTFRIR